jgi:hypothetical protein
VLLGDLIDNGPEGRGVIEQDMRRGATARDFTARRNEGSLSHGGRRVRLCKRAFTMGTRIVPPKPVQRRLGNCQ